MLRNSRKEEKDWILDGEPLYRTISNPHGKSVTELITDKEISDFIPIDFDAEDDKNNESDDNGIESHEYLRQIFRGESAEALITLGHMREK